MTKITMEEVRASLKQYHPTILSVVHGAWAEWRAVESFRQQQGFGTIAFKRTISNYMFDAIARLAVRAFAGEPGVHIRSEAQTVKFFAGGEVLFRFKKGDDAKLGCNILTEAVLSFIDADGVVPGLPAETAKVEVIWQPNEIWTEVERVLVIARDGDDLVWEYDLDGDAGGSTVIPFPTPLAPRPGDEDDVPLVRPRPAASPEVGADEK